MIKAVPLNDVQCEFRQRCRSLSIDRNQPRRLTASLPRGTIRHNIPWQYAKLLLLLHGAHHPKSDEIAIRVVPDALIMLTVSIHWFLTLMENFAIARA